MELLLANLKPGPLRGGGEAFAIEGFEEIVQGVDFKGAHRVLIIGSDENDAWQGLIPESLEHIEPAELRHLHIQENQIGSQRSDRANGFTSIAALAHNLGLRIVFEHFADHSASSRLVVDDQNPNPV